MNNSDIIGTIKRYGFTEYEAKCYLALFEKDSLSVADIADVADVPRANIYGIMKKLLARGLCVSLPGAIKKYSASDPGILKDELFRSLDESRMTINNLTTELISMYEKSRTDDSPLDYIEVFKDRLQMLRRFHELILNAKEELLTIEKAVDDWVLPPQEEYDRWIDESSQTVVELIKRGVKCRGVYKLSENSERRKRQIILMEKFVENGEELRIAKKLPIKAGTIDSKIVVVMMEDTNTQKPSYTSQIVHHRGMAETIKMAFDTMWAQAEDFSDFIKREKL